MAGIGKVAIAILLLVGLAFISLAAYSTAKVDQPTDSTICNGTCNSSLQISETVTTQSTNILVPAIIIMGIVFLFVVFTFMRKTVK